MELTFDDKKQFYLNISRFNILCDPERWRNFQTFYNISSLSDEMDNIIPKIILM